MSDETPTNPTDNKNEAAPAEPQGNIETDGKPESAPRESLLDAMKNVPEKYELKLPENALITQDDFKTVEEFARKNNLSNEAAQHIVNERNGAIHGFVERSQQSIVEQNQRWAQEIAADKEYGGEQYEQNKRYASAAVKAYAPPGFLEELNKASLDNHPGLFKMLARIGRERFGDDTLINTTTPPKGAEAPLEEQWYPKGMQQAPNRAHHGS